MHDSVLEWTAKTLTTEDIAGQHVLEVGSYNVNGSVRPIVEKLGPARYVGVDMSEGPGVDRVVDATALVDTFGADGFDVVLCTEVMEHVVDWQPVIIEMVDVLAPDGLLLITTRGPGFPYHPYPIDTWRYTVEAMFDILMTCGLDVRECVPDPQAPGVFALARKPLVWTRPWTEGLFDRVAVQPMVAP